MKSGIEFGRQLLLITTVVLAGLLAITTSSFAQQTNGSQNATTGSQIDDRNYLAPVMVDGRKLFVVRGLSALPAYERADIVAQRITEFASNTDETSVEMSYKDGEFGVEVLANGMRMTDVTATDANFENSTIPILAKLTGNVIEKAILQYRSDRSREARLGSVLRAGVWTLIFILVVYLTIKLRNFLSSRSARYVEKRLAKMDEATNEMVSSSALSALVRQAIRTVFFLLLAVMFYYYLSFVLLSFAETRPIANILIKYVTSPVKGLISGLVANLPDLIILAFIFYITRFAIGAVRLFFDNVEEGTIRLKNFEPIWIWPTYNIIRALIAIVAIVISYPYIPGSGSAAFQGLTILVGVMVSLGSNSVISNALAGLFVIYRRSTSVGDRISIGNHVGDVVQIKLMETLLKSVKNELISIPNAQLLNSEVVNYSTKVDGRGLLLYTTVGIGYEEPKEKIEALLIEAANRTKGLKKTPGPFVLYSALADYSVNYQVNGFTNRGDQSPVILSALRRNILEVFNDNDVQIMTPSYIADPEVPKIPESEWDGVLKPSKTVKE